MSIRLILLFSHSYITITTHSKTEHYDIFIVFICTCEELFLFNNYVTLSTIKTFRFVKICLYKLHIMEVAIEGLSGKYHR